MVYSLLFLASGRSVNFSLKTWQRSKVLLERKLPVRILPFPQYSSEDKEKSTPKQENKEKKEKKPPTDPKAHINYIIEEAKKGKLPVSEIKTLGQSVLTEAPYKNYSKAPQNVQYISFAGLVPMMGIPLMSLLSGHALPGLVFTQLAFGATVLSFLGGSAWHEAISKNDYSLMKLGWAITPQVIGWISLLLPIPLGILLTSGGFCLSLVHDVLLASYPAWMKSLRLILTGGTLVSYGLMLIFYLILSRRSWSSRSRSRTDSRSRSASSDKKRTHSGSSSSKSHSRSRSTSRDKSKSRKPESSSSSSRSKESPKRLDSPPKVTVPRYYGRNRKDSSSSLSLDSSDTDSKTNFSQPSSSNSNRNNIKKNASDDYSSGCRSAGNARSTSKQTPKERPQEKLKKKMQALLNKQFRADKKAEKERMEKAEQERQDREAELRDIAIKIRRRERYLRHRGEDEENDGEREALRRRERYLRRSEEEEGKRVEKRDGDRWSESSESGKSKSRSPEGKSRRSRSPRRSRRSRSSSPKPSRLAKSSRTLVDY